MNKNLDGVFNFEQFLQNVEIKSHINSKDSIAHTVGLTLEELEDIEKGYNILTESKLRSVVRCLSLNAEQEEELSFYANDSMMTLEQMVGIKPGVKSELGKFLAQMREYVAMSKPSILAEAISVSEDELATIESGVGYFTKSQINDIVNRLGLDHNQDQTLQFLSAKQRNVMIKTLTEQDGLAVA